MANNHEMAGVGAVTIVEVIRALQLPARLEAEARALAAEHEVRIYRTDKGPQYKDGRMFMGFSRTPATTEDGVREFEDGLRELILGQS